MTKPTLFQSILTTYFNKEDLDSDLIVDSEILNFLGAIEKMKVPEYDAIINAWDDKTDQSVMASNIHKRLAVEFLCEWERILIDVCKEYMISEFENMQEAEEDEIDGSYQAKQYREIQELG